METRAKCSCGNYMCLDCGKEDHQPCNCVQVKAWLDKEEDNNENLTWLKANTKPCPGCGSFIEKNQGCNHIHCRHCGHDFCWLCKGLWKDHGSGTGGYYACNIYEEKKKDKDFQN